MNGKERVIRTIKQEKADRTPLYGWVKANLEEPISARWGSVEAFEDKYEFDLAHIFGGPSPYDGSLLEEARRDKGCLEPSDLLALPLSDPLDESAYDNIREALKFHGGDRGRFCYVQTPGIFEANNGPFGIENHLAYLLLFPDEMRQVYERQARWNRSFADVCMDLGVDMIHISDDWGAQNSLLFDPKLWKEMIAPYVKVTADRVKERGCFLSLHSDGNINAVLPGIAELGFDVLHPYQESAGMDYRTYLTDYSKNFVILGGMDVQTTMGFGKTEWAKSEIRRVVETFNGRGLLLCTTHYVQNHCTMDELEELFDFAYALIRG